MHKSQKKVLFTATVDSHILAFHLPFLKWFKEQGYEVHVATNGDEEIPYCDKKIKISFERSPFKLNNIKAIFQLKTVLLKEKYDIIHTHTPMGSVVTRLAAKKARKQGTRVIYTAHGFHFYKGAPLLNWCLFYPVEKYLSKYTDTLILINKEDYDLATKKFKKCKDIEYVPGVGIDEKKFDVKMTEEDKHRLRKELGLKGTDFVMIYPAELNKNKNQIMLIDAMEQLIDKYPDIHLLLPGKDSYNGYYQKIVEEKKIDKNIHFLGFRKDIPRLLKISDLSVATSKREGLPVNILEAMYIGLPIIATNCRGQRDLVDNDENGFLVDFSLQDLVSKIIEVYDNQEVRDRMKKNSQKKIQVYTLNNILKSMINIYNKKKKILHLLASNKFSGAENVVCQIIKMFTNSEYEMYYCSPDGDIRKYLKKENINFVPLKKLSLCEIRKVIKKIKPDIIHAHDNKATTYASLLKRDYKLISHIHGNNKIMNSINLKTIIFNICSKKVNRFIWVSDSSLNGYIYSENVKKRSSTLYNVINAEDLIKNSTEYKCEEQYDMIYLGRLAYPKNPERLINIIKLIISKNPNIKVAIVGDGEDKEKVESLINKYKIQNNIKMYGYVQNPYPILLKSKILVMTSIYEGTPMCALEAQALGKPIIATPVDGLKDIIKNDVNGYLTDDNEKFANKILHSLNKKEYKKLSSNTVKEFTIRNNVNVYANKIKQIYEEK